jgi:uncharacterized membrane protein (DUF2068 family)
LLSAFFGFGAVMAFLSFLGLLVPGGFLEPMWRLNPRAHAALGGLQAWGIALMLLVAIACAGAAVGLWTRARWGLWLAVVLLTSNLVGDLVNALRGDPRTLIGLPIAAALIFYLLSARTRAQFETRSTAAP